MIDYKKASRVTFKIFKPMLLTVLIAVIFMGGLVTVFKKIKFFSIRHIEVSIKTSVNPSHLTETVILKLINIHEGVGMLSVDLDQTHDDILVNPWVKSAIVSRKWNDTIRINVEEKNPVAIFNAEKMIYVSDDGQLIDKVEGTNALNYPIITLDQSPVARMKTLIHPILNLVEIFKKEHKYEISEIHVTNLSDDLEVYLLDNPFPINFGSSNFESRYVVFAKIYQDLSKRSYQCRYLDLTLDNKGIAKIKI